MKSSHSPEARERARHLVVSGGLTLSEASERTNIPEGTLKRWAASEGWIQTRDSLVKYEQSVRELKVKLLEKAVADCEPERVTAWVSVERCWPEKVYGEKALKREVVMDVLEGFVAAIVARKPSPEFIEQLHSYMGEYFAGLSE